MSFVDAVRSGFNNYANFSGRALRSEYWWWVVFVWIAGIVANIIDRALGWSIYQTTMNGIQQSSGPVAAIFALAVLIPGLAVLVRRLHDTDHSGWWFWLVWTQEPCRNGRALGKAPGPTCPPRGGPGWSGAVWRGGPACGPGKAVSGLVTTLPASLSAPSAAHRPGRPGPKAGCRACS